MWDKLMNTNWWEMFVKFVFEGIRKIIIIIANLIIRVRQFAADGEWSKKHLSFVREGVKFKLIVKSHDDFVAEIQEKIDSFKKKDKEEKYIKYALEQALGGCMYIVISKGEKFVQFWTGRGKLDFDFPMVKDNENKKYYYQVMGLLADMGFVRNTFSPPSVSFGQGSSYNTYSLEEGVGIRTITGFFKKMTPEATQFTMKMFGEIYRKKKDKLEIVVG